MHSASSPEVWFFLMLSKLLTNRFAIWRFSSVSTLKIVINGYNYLELGKAYDALDFLLNRCHGADCVRYMVLFPLRDFCAHVQQPRGKNFLSVPEYYIFFVALY
jgi:hypothetical protein